MVDLSELAKILPPLIPRSEVPNLLPGLFSKKYLANLNSLGEGPPYIKIRRKVVYKREPFIAWLESITTIMPEA
jgi:hypothetical protein